MQHGLLKGSFIPHRPQRELRDLTRYRTQLVEEKGRSVNRLQKILEDANIKLASVASDILGVGPGDAPSLESTASKIRLRSRIWRSGSCEAKSRNLRKRSKGT
jgi:transposase